MGSGSDGVGCARVGAREHPAEQEGQAGQERSYLAEEADDRHVRIQLQRLAWAVEGVECRLSQLVSLLKTCIEYGHIDVHVQD